MDVDLGDEAGVPLTVGVDVFPAEVVVGPNQTRHFQARVRGSLEREVAWSIRSPDALDAESQPAGSGTISLDGVYTATATVSGPWAIIATSVAEPRARSISSVTVAWPVVEMTSPATGSLELGVGETFLFEAHVQGESGPTTDSVIWSIVEGQPYGGTITPTGLYTAPSSPGTFHIRATNANHPRINYVATIEVTSNESVIVSVEPKNIKLVAGETLKMTARVTNAVFDSVIWSSYNGSNPVLLPTIEPFTQQLQTPTELEATTLYTLRATSAEDPTVTDEAQVRVLAEAPASTITGSVVYSGQRTGQIYVTCMGDDQAYATTSLSSSGDFNLYAPGCDVGDPLVAWMDTLGTGWSSYAAAPTGTMAIIAGNNEVTISDPIQTTTPVTVEVEQVIPGAREIAVAFEPIFEGNLEQADHYRLYASSTPNPGPLNAEVTRTVRAGVVAPLAIVGDLSADTAYYIGISAIKNGIVGPIAVAPSPVLVRSETTTPGGVSVQGALYVPPEWFRTTAKTLRIIALAEESGTPVFQRIPLDRAGTRLYSLSGFTAGTYQMAVIIDRDDNGEIGPEDMLSRVLGELTVTGTASVINGPLLNVPPPVAATVVTEVKVTQSPATHKSRERIQLQVFGEAVTRAVLIGPSATDFQDLGRTSGGTDNQYITIEGVRAYHERSADFTTGQDFEYLYYRMDGTASNRVGYLTGYVTLGAASAPPQPPATSTSTPTFTWVLPTSTGGDIVEMELYIFDEAGVLFWHEELSPTTTSTTYSGAEALQNDTEYNWELRVHDAKGNGGTYAGSFLTAP